MESNATKPASEPASSILFPVSPMKLIVMDTVTFGIYGLYWAYKNWRWFERDTNKKVVPFIEAIFLPLTLFDLCQKVRDLAWQKGSKEPLPIFPIAAAFFLLNAAGRLPGAFCLISLLSVLPILVVQGYINDLNKSVNPDFEMNSKFTVWNWVGIVIGSIWLLLSIIGLFLPPDASST